MLTHIAHSVLAKMLRRFSGIFARSWENLKVRQEVVFTIKRVIPRRVSCVENLRQLTFTGQRINSQWEGAPKDIGIPLLTFRGGSRNFPTGGLTLPTRGLKYGFQAMVNAKSLQQNSFSPSDGGLACSNRGI